jgi:RNA polymerase sigma-70 factor (ECF subfamily)
MPDPINAILSQIKSGERNLLDQLIPLVYQELHRMAEGYLRREAHSLTLQPTALIHEAYLRLVEHGAAEYKGRAHFFGVVARVMRQILVDHARARGAMKRGTVTETFHPRFHERAPQGDRAVVALHDALTALAIEDEWRAGLVEMRFFGGMTTQEIADCLGKPLHVVRRDLRVAQAWLLRAMTPELPR